MKQLAKRLFQSLGYDIQRRHLNHPADIGTASRPIGSMKMLLEDLHFRGFHPQSILDVGANRADWSRMAKSIFKKADFFLIEPQIEMKSALDAFCEEFPGSHYFLAGAGANPGELVLTIWDDLAGSSLLPPESEELRTEGKQRSVPIITINSLLEENMLPMPQLVKLDIQGFELEALKGGANLFGNVEVFILEVSLFEFMAGQPLFAEVVTFMKNWGYLVYDFPGFLRRPYDGALGQCDICFVKHDGFLRTKNVWS
jgi:FkbM family methyltransferase